MQDAMAKVNIKQDNGKMQPQLPEKDNKTYR